MLRIGYSVDEEIVIFGSSKEIEELQQKVLDFLKTSVEKIQIETDNTIASDSFDFIAEGLEIVQNGKAVKVSVSGDKVIKIEGSKENLERFTSFLEFEENPIEGRHSHYEYFDGNEYIDSESLPLIIGIR
ncbi:MAG TPA: hypothetical protein PKE69_18620 [Pyrinomonadaceae bacterium]|nr:hypothetical protein [Pyrinomonadaceae bacterium]